jgi:hypothetical protein
MTISCKTEAGRALALFRFKGALELKQRRIETESPDVNLTG